MKSLKKFITFDYWCQSLLILFAGFGVVSAIASVSMLLLPLIIMIPLGFWQVLSGIILTIWQRDANRGVYLAVVIAFFYISTTLIFTYKESHSGFYYESLGVKILYSFAVLIPLSLAGYYYYLTRKDYRALKQIRNVGEDEFENILDDFKED